MTNDRKAMLRQIMQLAWQFVRDNGYTLSCALKCAWANVKLTKAMQGRIVQFFFFKVDGTMRQAFGTLDPHILPETLGTGRKAAKGVQVYFDTERREYRSFKKCNLAKVVAV